MTDGHKHFENKLLLLKKLLRTMNKKTDHEKVRNIMEKDFSDNSGSWMFMPCIVDYPIGMLNHWGGELSWKLLIMLQRLIMGK